MGYVKHSNFVNLLQERAVSHPDKVIFTFLGDGETETESLTYQQLDNQAKAIAENLSEIARNLLGNKGEGQRALLLYQPGLEFITAFLGCLYAGIIATPAYPPRQNRSFIRLETIIKDAGALFALTTESLKQKIEQKLTKNSDIICIPTDNIALALAENWQKSPYIQEDNLAFLQYTSGSTGTPKGVMVSHGNLIHNSYLISSYFENNGKSVGCSWLPPYHDMGLIGGILQPIYAAISTIVLPPVSFLQRPIRWLRAISQYKVTTTGGPNFAYEMCINSISEKQKADLDLSSWDLAFSGAEPVRAETIAKFSEYFGDCGFKREAFYPCYGMAETTLIVSGASKNQSPTVKIVSAEALTQNNIIPVNENTPDSQVLVSSGKIAGELQSLIVNPDTLEECAENEVGEIWVKGASVTQGYWQREEATENIFHAYTKDTKSGPFLRTGDLGFISDGELFVTGRLKDLIIVRGRNHYPQDIEESVANCHEAINSENGAAFAIDVADEEQLVVIFEVKRTFFAKINQDEGLKRQIFQQIRQTITENHELQVYSIVLLKTGSIPKTSSGKIARYACRQKFLDNTLQVVAQWDLQGDIKNPTLTTTNPEIASFVKIDLAQESGKLLEIQTWLRENIANRLGVTPQAIDVQQPFINYGLDSVEAVRLTADLEDWLDCRLSPTLAYDYPNIATLAHYLAEEKTEEKTSVIPVTNNQSRLNNTKIAIIGMACRFSEAGNCEEYWQLLSQGKDTIKRTHRPNLPYLGGYIDNYDQFDPHFFEISPREAVNIDPQQRILLQVTHEALENANVTVESLSGSNTGVFIGISSSDYAQLQVKNRWDVNVYTGTGNAASISANRISYSYNLLGPSLSVDTACSSSLVAVHLAVNSLKNGECNQAIVGGVNLILSPELTETFQKAGMMAEDGKCKTFSADADGYVRGEGCGVIILKPLDRSITDGDNILAVIHGSAINQDGRSNGLTAPSGKAQQRVIQSAWQNAGITADKINYIEAHGTGTALGDPIELNSLSELLSSHPEQEFPTWVGSAKTNIGHLEAAAGIAGLIKTVLALKHQIIPPSINFTELNPYINLGKSRVKIARESIPWPSSPQPRYAGISSFGFGGTNAHIIVGDNSEKSIIENVPLKEDNRPYPTHHLLTISAQTETGLGDLITRYQDYLQEKPDINFADICFTANVGRSMLKYKLALVGKNRAEILSQLKLGKTKTVKNSQIAFLFTGQGSQYSKMGYELYQTSPTFKNTVDYCEQILNKYLDKPITEILFNSKNQGLLNQTIYTQPALFVIEYALAKLWLTWGIKPAIVVGHSVGEYVAAAVAGVFSLEDGLKLIAYRGKLIQKLPQDGGMLCLFTNEKNVNKLIKKYGNQVEISVINGDNNVVISGYRKVLVSIESEAIKQKIKAKKLTVSHGFHSFLMESILSEFREIATTINYNLPNLPIISNVTGKANNKEIATAEYWVEHIIKPVKFNQSLALLRQENYQILLEIGAKPILLGMAEHSLNSHNYVYLPSLRKGSSDWRNLLSSLAELYNLGIKINWSNFYQDYPQFKKVQLPNYPWQNQRYWLGDETQNHDLSLDWLYKLHWLKGEDLTVNHDIKNSYLIFAKKQCQGEKLASQLISLGNQVYLVYQGKEYKQQGNCYWLNPCHPEDYENLWRNIHQPIDKIVYFWGLQELAKRETLDLAKTEFFGCLPVIYLLQSLVITAHKTKLWLITQLSQSVTTQDKINPQGGSLWGLGKVIAVEHPEYWGGIIDIDNEENSLHSSLLLGKIKDDSPENMSAIRGENIYYPRLQKQPHGINKNSLQISINDESSYLITGGLGALGIQCAKWLIRQGAKKIILMSRRQPSVTIQRQLESWQQQGIKIIVAKGDVSNFEDLKRVFQQITSSLFPLKGIIHSAGVLADGILTTLTADKLESVMSPKILGTWNLHHLTLDLPLDFFVMFSSVASLLGSAGQGNYGAANGYLDSFASYRHSLNLPALTINWGAFDVGMAELKQHSLTASGIDLINVHEGINLLRDLINSSVSQWGVVKINWEKVAQKFPDLSASPYLTDIIAELDQKTFTNQSVNNLFTELTQADSQEREILLVDYLKKAIASILHFNPEEINPDESLLDLGMDSLMVMEVINYLKTDLQLMLYPREFYERPRISALAGYLTQEFATTHDQAKDKPPFISSSPQPSFAGTKEGNQETTGDYQTSIANPSLSMANYQLSINPHPIAFILSSPRSGSTLLRVMLAGHPNLVSPPELHLLPFADMQQRQKELEASHLGEGLIRTVMDLKNISAKESETLVNQWVEENLSIPELYKILQELSGNRLLVDKSPTYGMAKETLDHAQRMFQGAKYIHLIRHPYSVIESFVRLRMDKLLALSDANPYEIAESIWYKTNQNILDFIGQLDGKKVYQVYYEDLVTQPAKIMREMCNFLKIPFSESVLNPYEGERMTDGVHSKSMSVGDPSFNTRQHIDPQLADHWRKIQLPIFLNPVTVNLAESFNYQLPHDAQRLEMTEKYVNVRGLNLCVCRWGNPKNPVIVLIHGILDQGYAWEKVAQSLAKQGYYIIAPDLRGHGKSDHVSQGCSYNLLDFVADLDGLTDELTDKPFTLVGHSLGSIIAAVFANMRLQKVNKLVLVEPVLPVESNSNQDLSNITSQLEYLVSPPPLPIFPDVETVAQRLRMATHDLTPDFALSLAKRTTRLVDNGVTFIYAPLLTTRAGVVNSINRGQYLQLLSQINIPLTIIYGDRSNFNRKEDLQAQELAMPQAHKVTIEGGHNLPLEKPNNLAAIILQRIKE